MCSTIQATSCDDLSPLSPSQLRELCSCIERAREEERARIAREIHDELGQCLTMLRMDLSLIRSHHHANHPELNSHTTRMQATLDQSLATVRSIATHLRPAVLDRGLIAAAEWLLSQLKSHTPIRSQFESSPNIPALGDESATALFRILQESLTNVARHSNATQIKVSIRHHLCTLALEVSDDGVGFELEQNGSQEGFGLRGIRERAFMLGGLSTIESAPGHGTTVKVVIPVDGQANRLLNTQCKPSRAGGRTALDIVTA
jgi:signal transduction histidine kinase